MAVIFAPLCHAADLVFIGSAAGSPGEREEMEIATNFYGLTLDVVTANDEASLRRLSEQKDLAGIAIAADALTIDNGRRLLHVWNLVRKGSVPLLILNVTDEADSAALRAWSGGTVSGCRSFDPALRPYYAFDRVDGLTGPLSGVEVWNAREDASRLELEAFSALRPILSLRDDGQAFPVFVETTVKQAKVFVACAVRPAGDSADAGDILPTFLRVAPAMMFAKHTAGARGWQAPRHYANMTIDDPWLRQPYGYVDYDGLLQEMDKHNFHTTIAFIPWNYARSEAGVVSLFRSRPDRFSIAIHGDNHDHKEFTDYQDKPLTLQADALKQSLARMERFRTLTGIPYDKVMVFPHSIAPLETLASMKIYGYWGTINASNVPQGQTVPSPSFALRPATFAFAGFPSLSRHSFAAPIFTAFFAVNAYLDNPMFFYGHTEDFAKGIGAFNEVADQVNRLQPDTQWTSLGEIVRHLYLLRTRDDSGYDVLALSNNFCVENRNQRDAMFHVQKEEVGEDAIHAVLADGQPYPYQVQDGQLTLSMMVPKGSARCVAVQYHPDLDLSSVAPAHDSSVVYLLRMASDFRDIYLSQSPAGLAFIRFYNESPRSTAVLLGFALVFLLPGIYGTYRLWMFARSKRRGQAGPKTSFVRAVK